MPKRYEEEINEILGKYDWPSDSRARRPRSESVHRADPLGAAGRLLQGFGAPQLMAAGLILILAGVVLRFAGNVGLTLGPIGGYLTALGFVVLLVGYILAVLRGGSGSPGFSHRSPLWRGHVVDLRPSNRGPGYWWWRLRTNLRRRF